MEAEDLACHQKKAQKEGRTIVFIDESGLSQRPHRCRTWAPRGQTPVLQYHLFRKCLRGWVRDGRVNSNPHTQLLQATEVVPHETVFLIGSSARRIFGVGLPRFEHLIDGD